MIDENENPDSTYGAAGARRLRLFRRGAFRFGIFENEIAAIAEWREPAPLPRAPDSVLGIVSIQGRMLTVLDVAMILSGETRTKELPNKDAFRQILALRGDEQLGLAVDETGETIDITENALEKKSETGLIHAVFKHGASETSILNVYELFPTAIQGRERRRRRF